MEKSILVGNSQISYLDLNTDKENILLFIHGNSSSKETFNNLLPFLNEYRVVALDLLGHGSSSASSDGHYSLTLWGKQVASFVEVLNLKNYVLLGHSLGGHIALEAYYYLKVKPLGLAVWGCTPLGKPAELGKAFLPNENIAVLFESAPEESRIIEFFKSSLNLNPKSDEFDVLLKDFIKVDSCMRPSIGQSLENNDFNDEMEMIRSLKSKALIIHASNDTIIDGNYFKEFFKECNLGPEDLQYREIATGHYPQVENGRELIYLLDPFMANWFTSNRIKFKHLAKNKNMSIELERV
jgi:pimeloyl-ACP methyl ester carboxylesterase